MAEFVLRYPRLLACGNVLVCAVLGFFLEKEFGSNLFERFGALSVGASVFVFGIAVADLINRGQGMNFERLPMIDDKVTPEERKKLGGVRSWDNVSITLNSQAYALLIGTAQASFGSLFLGMINANP